MRILLVFIVGLVAFERIAPVLQTGSERTALQSTASLERRLTSRIVVTVPADDAELVVNGAAIGGQGASRTFADSAAGRGDPPIYLYRHVEAKPLHDDDPQQDRCVPRGRDGPGESHR